MILKNFYTHKILILLAFLCNLFSMANADVMPYYVHNINTNTIGVYQAPNGIRVFKEPNENSKLLFEVNWNEKNYDCSDLSASNLFVVFLPKKNLAFLSIVDENDNEDWVQISYNQNGIKTGWIKKDDPYRFMNWRSFFNLYGRKYGLYYMKDAPDESKIIYGSTSEEAKSIGKLTLPQKLKLTNVSGNWLLIIGFDIDRIQKIGWIKWRNLSGEIFLFPDIK